MLSVRGGPRATIGVLAVLWGAAACRTPSAPIPRAARASTALWRAYAQAPDVQPNIPNCSFAGYRAGERPIPAPDVVATVPAPAAADDTLAIQQAIDEAARRGGGAVRLSEGVYRLNGMLRITSSRVVLRGAGASRTTLVFARPLSAILGPLEDHGASRYSWFGGLVWLTPADNFDAGGMLSERYTQGWSPRRTLATVSAPARRGAAELIVADGAALVPGSLVVVEWHDAPDHSLFAHLTGLGHFPWAGSSLTDEPVRWPVEIRTVDGSRVTLAQPLRIDVRPEWSAVLAEPAPLLEEVGVEHLALRMESGAPSKHGEEQGFNGIFLDRVRDAWIDDVILENVDSGILTTAVKRVTVRRFVVTGDRPHHHGTYSKHTHDTLFEDFRVDSRPLHGLDVELSTGVVWHRGDMRHGTFDGHRAMSFDLLRTNLRIHNDGQEGGDRGNPHNGAHVVHWNVEVSGSARAVGQPAFLPFGAIVGLRGVDVDTSPDPDKLMPSDNGCVVADPGVEPEPIDLFEAQRSLRLPPDHSR